MNELLKIKEKEIKLKIHLVCTRANYDIQEEELKVPGSERLRSYSL